MEVIYFLFWQHKAFLCISPSDFFQTEELLECEHDNKMTGVFVLLESEEENVQMEELTTDHEK